MITMIAAVGKNSELGRGSDLIWHLKDDMKFFRKTTSGHNIIMGRKTFESLGGLLPNRHHIILTSNKEYAFEGAEVSNSFENILAKCENSYDEYFVIGGGEIYKLFLPYAKKMYLTEIDAECADAEVYFPEFNKNLYTRNVISHLEENGIQAEIAEYIKNE